MQDEELDRIINNAANQYQPPYSDEAWGRMLVLLDKNLPQKRDRKKNLLLALLFMLLGGAITFGILQPWKTDNTADNGIAKVEVEQNSNATENNVVKNSSSVPSSIGTQQQNSIQPVVDNSNSSTETTTASSVQKTALPDKSIVNNAGIVTNKQVAFTANNKIILKQKSKTTAKIKTPVATQIDEPAVKESGNSTENYTTPAQIAEKPNAETNITPNKEEGNSLVKNTDTSANQKLKKEATETKSVATKNSISKNKKFVRNFEITFSGGADVSFIKTNNLGKLNVVLGAGIAYAITKKLKVRTGFYAANKVYTAAPDQYKFHNGATYPNLKSINAECKIYEIPLTVTYNFANAKKHSWFGGAGLSSFLMKKEYYKYHYKNAWGQYYSYEKTVNNENKHYFSVITLSSGYSYQLNNRFSFIAEPYIKLPLKGVGAGEIKLKSGGVLVTVAIKPFIKK